MNTPSPLFPEKTPWRCLAPAGGFATGASLLRAARNRKGHQKFRDLLEVQLKAFFRAQAVRTFGSGTESLYRLLVLIKETRGLTEVLMGGYSCPDIVAACARAGFRVRVGEIDEKSLLLRNDSATAENCVVILSNLYGLPDSIEHWPKSSIVIDDACQAALSSDGERPVGARADSFGIVSFGRGKALGGVGGGAIVFPNGQASNISGVIQKISWFEEGSSYLEWLISRALEHPMLYRIPASMPFLSLGETHYQSDISLRSLGEFESVHALAQLDCAEQTRQILVANSQKWHRALEGCNVIEPFVERGFSFNGSVVPIRYPILFRTREERTEAFRGLEHAGMGASISYGAALNQFVPKQVVVGTPSWKSAESAAERILTLPVHRFVETRDIECSVGIIRKVMT